MLSVLVDYDNVDEKLKRAGVIEAAAEISRLIPAAVITQYDAIRVRIYGGWRSGGNLTRVAQAMLPVIRQESPRPFTSGSGTERHTVRLELVLADTPAWSGSIFNETFVTERAARKFRSRREPWLGCANETDCGMAHLRQIKYSDTCQASSCALKAQDLLVRDEQKMVDTLIVADMAYLALQERVKNIVVVSSDIDMWPGVLLATSAGCLVTHIHTKEGWKTQHHLRRMLENGRSDKFYEQVSPR